MQIHAAHIVELCDCPLTPSLPMEAASPQAKHPDMRGRKNTIRSMESDLLSAGPCVDFTPRSETLVALNKPL